MVYYAWLNVVQLLSEEGKLKDHLPRAILFDLDDTLLMDSASTEDCWRSACQRCCPPTESIEPEALLTAIQTERGWFWSDPERHRKGRLDLEAARHAIVAGALRQLGIEQPTLASAIVQAFAELRDKAIQPFPDALATLRFLRQRGVRLALLTEFWRGEGPLSLAMGMQPRPVRVLTV